MKKYILPFLLLLASPCFAGMGIGGFPCPGPGVNPPVTSTPTWFYSTVSDADQLVADLATYPSGADVTVGTSTNITALAFLVRDKTTATSCKLALYDTGSPGTLVASGTCTPANDTWCVASASGTVSASTKYRGVVSCDTGTVWHRGVHGANVGVFIGIGTNYSTFPAGTDYFTIDRWDSMSFAVCTGGTCGANR